MPTSPDHELDHWIAARKEAQPAHLAPSVMREIQQASDPICHSSPKPEHPSWLLASTCLIAGVGKLSLIFHFAF